MELKESSRSEEVSSAKAVQVGALAPGINGPTRNTLKRCIFNAGFVSRCYIGLGFFVKYFSSS